MNLTKTCHEALAPFEICCPILHNAGPQIFENQVLLHLLLNQEDS